VSLTIDVQYIAGHLACIRELQHGVANVFYAGDLQRTEAVQACCHRRYGENKELRADAVNEISRSPEFSRVECREVGFRNVAVFLYFGLLELQVQR